MSPDATLDPAAGGLDVAALRAATPGVAHGIHLSAAGSALMPAPVVDAVKAHIDLEAEVGGYEAHALRFTALEAVYGSVAELVGGRPEEIALVENATVAWCQAFYALALEPGDRVLTCEAEYGANYVAMLHRAKRDGIVIDVVPSTVSGEVDLDALDRMIDDRVKLIALTWIPTNGGLVNDASGVGRVARARGVPFLLDACQAVGQLPIDVADIGCDFLSATGRKFLRAPRGTGFLWVDRDRLPGLEPAMIDHYGAEWSATDDYRLRDDARRFENWENAYALRAGLGVAVDYALSLGLESIRRRAWALAAHLRDELDALAGARIRDLGAQRCAIVSFTVDGLDPEPTVAALRGHHGISIGTTDPPSTRLDAERRNLPMMFRAAPHYYNTAEEVEALVHALDELRG